MTTVYDPIVACPNSGDTSDVRLHVTNTILRTRRDGGISSTVGLHQSKVVGVAVFVANDLRRMQMKVMDAAEITRVTSLPKSHTHIMQLSCYEVWCDSGMN